MSLFAQEFFPTPEDWNALQGGKPRIFRYPDHMRLPLHVVHVYEQHADPEKRFQSGIVVDTIKNRTGNLQRVGIERHDEDGLRVAKDIIVPSFMNRHVHGGVCGATSMRIGGESYEQIKDQARYEEFVDYLQIVGAQELRYGMVSEGIGVALIPLPEIRPATPLE